MNPLQERIEHDLKEALRAGEAMRLSVLRMVSAAIHNREIEKRTKKGTSELGAEEVVSVLRAETKKRKDAAEGFKKGGRAEQAEQERKEAEMIQSYLPVELSDGEIGSIVSEVVSDFGEVSAKDFGKVMGEAMKRIQGRASGDRVSSAVRNILGG